MDIWLIQNGEKSGPFRDYEIRRRILNAEITADVPAWHEGLGNWQPLGEMQLFRREFEQPPLHERFQDPSPEVDASHTPVKIHYLRRFWARWFDIYLYASLWWLALWLAGRDLAAIITNQWIMVFYLLPWFVIETLLLHRYGITLGKWLLGLRVTNEDSSLMTLAQSTRRSAKVLFTGIGFGWNLLALFCQLLSFFTTKRLGRPLWDYSGKHQVKATPLSVLKISGFVALFIGALYLQAIVTAPYMYELLAKELPPLREVYEKGPPFWHLPKRP